MSHTDWSRRDDLSTARFRADFNAVRLACLNHNQIPRMASMPAEHRLLRTVVAETASCCAISLPSRDQEHQKPHYKSLKDRFTVTNTSLWSSSSTPADASAVIGVALGLDWPSLESESISQFPPYAAIISHASLRAEASDGRRNKRLAACVVSFEVSLVGLLGLAALLLLLALACRLATGLHLVDDEACVTLLAIPLEALEVRVCQLVVGLERNVSLSSLITSEHGWQKRRNAPSS